MKGCFGLGKGGSDVGGCWGDCFPHASLWLLFIIIFFITNAENINQGYGVLGFIGLGCVERKGMLLEYRRGVSLGRNTLYVRKLGLPPTSSRTRQMWYTDNCGYTS